ncbi:MAG TPA: hypothetical protein VF115_08670 [Acidimicrobiia bacterium]
MNGGYVAGILGDAARLHTSSARLSRPVPIETPLHLVAEDGWAALRHCDQTLAETVETTDRVGSTGFVPRDEAVNAGELMIDLGVFADCFVCGRDGEDGLGIRPKPLADGRFAAVWRPGSSGLIEAPTVPIRYLHSALDCPGGFAAIAASGKLAVTGSLTSRIDFLPESDRTLIVVAEAVGAEGRTLHAVTTIFTESGEIVATAEAIWVTLGAMPIDFAA